MKYIPGIDTLLNEHAELLSGKRVGLVAHPASVDTNGRSSALRLHDACNLSCILGPEHGYLGAASAGKEVSHTLHTKWNIPIFSLYGKTRRLTPEMLDSFDVLIFDLQTLAVRCYTYISTLLYLMEDLNGTGKQLIVTDRCVPLHGVVDGPELDPAYRSFVGYAPLPYCYGKSAGEVALELQHQICPQLDLEVISYSGFSGQEKPKQSWLPPSPGIPTWETAQVYPTTVFAEALPALDYGRGTDLVFRCWAAPWIEPEKLIATTGDLPGLVLHAVSYTAQGGLYDSSEVHGIQFVPEAPEKLQPMTAAILILNAIQKLYGKEQLWEVEDTRPEFFDKLAGSPVPRMSINL